MSAAAPENPMDMHAPGRFSPLADADQRGVDLWVAVHRSLEVFHGNAISGEVGVRDGDDEVVV